MSTTTEHVLPCQVCGSFPHLTYHDEFDVWTADCHPDSKTADCSSATKPLEYDLQTCEIEPKNRALMSWNLRQVLPPELILALGLASYYLYKIVDSEAMRYPKSNSRDRLIALARLGKPKLDAAYNAVGDLVDIIDPSLEGISAEREGLL